VILVVIVLVLMRVIDGIRSSTITITSMSRKLIYS
jgi:hypothetical protein